MFLYRIQNLGRRVAEVLVCTRGAASCLIELAWVSCAERKVSTGELCGYINRPVIPNKVYKHLAPLSLTHTPPARAKHA